MTSRFFWIIGDDDMPRAGVVRELLTLLERENPDLVYLNSDWRQALTDNDPHDPVTTLEAASLDRMSFARRVHVWSTFISGMVVNRDRYFSRHENASLRRFAGTGLVQLAWVLETLNTGRKFLHVEQRCVLATAGNTGGYAVFHVFGANFPHLRRRFRRQPCHRAHPRAT